MTKDEIKERFKLKEYTLTVDLTTIPLGSHIKYFKRDGDNLEDNYRSGGFLKRIDPGGKFIVITNRSFDWTLKAGENTFFVKPRSKFPKPDPTKRKTTKTTQPKKQTIKKPKKPSIKKQIREKENIIMDQMDEIDKLNKKMERLLKRIKNS